MNINNWYYDYGRKKTSISKTFIKIGKGYIDINHKHKNIFLSEIYNILTLINEFKFNIKIIVKGGGINSQISATINSLSKNLSKINNRYKIILNKHKMLKYDSRIVESKNTGYVKSRKKHQFTKR